MTHRPLLASLALATVLTSGCLFSKKSAPKENTAPAAETEQIFMQRSVDKRAAELVAQGLTADAARAQATTEFKERYGFNSAAKK